MATIRVYRDEADGEEFPRLCVRCGADAEFDSRQKFSWHPPWVIVLIFVALLVYLIVALVLTKKMTVTLPVCRRHRNHWLSRKLFVGLGLLFWVVYVIAAAVFADQLPKDATPVLIGVGIFGALGWLITAVILQNASVKPKEITDRYIELTGVDRGFADVWEEVNPPPKPKRRPARRRYDDEYDDDEDDRPRGRRDDRYEDDETDDRPRRGRPDDRYDDYERR
ncbi:MAG: hypothetical protein K2X82_23800 [Gemmataceae bacterium]|nr:hypothetical protein [Gemmataceae bacterium]